MSSKIWKGAMLGVMMSLGIAVQAQEDQVLMTIAGEEVSAKEFLAIYNKNNTANVIDKKSMDEYLDLFINFKLKVKEAETLGMDTNQKFVSELSGYRTQLAKPYLIDKNMTEQLIKEAYDRLKQEVAAYHLLIRVDENAAAADTLRALNKVKKVAREIKTEKDMQRIIAQYRADDDANTIGEDLGYFSAFNMVYPFESAAYETEPGSLSKPVRSRFGYHVIFVRHKRAARGEIRTSHIFIQSNERMSPDEQQAAKARIDEIYQRLEAGETFEDLVKQYSEDKSTSSKGGLLPWMGTRGASSNFIESAFAIKQIGAYAPPVQTEYGWHIIRKEDERGIGSLEEMQAEIKRKIEKDSRGLKGRTSLLRQLKQEYAMTVNTKNKAAALAQVDQSYLEGKWRWQPEGNWQAPVLTIEDNKYSNSSKSFSQKDFLTFLSRTQRKANLNGSLTSVLDRQWNAYVNAKLIEFEDSILEKKYDKFDALMREYHDGILLFDLMDERVWSKAIKDSAGLANFYETHKEDYMWGDRVDASIYVCANDAVAKQVEKLAKKRVKKGYTDSDIMTKVNDENPLDLSIRSGIYSKGDDNYVDMVTWEEGIHRIEKQPEIVLVQIHKFLSPMPKKLSEARGMVTSDYQQYLEQQWIQELREKYEVVVNYEVFEAIKG